MSAVGGFTMSMISTLSGIYLIKDVGLGPFQLVLVGSVLEGSVLLFEVPTGVVADSVSRRLSVLIGFFLTGAGFLLYAVPSFGIVLAAQVVWGVGATFISGANVAWLVDEIGEDAARPMFLRASQLAQTCAFAGIVASVALGSVALGLPVAIGGVAYLALGVWLLGAMLISIGATIFVRRHLRDRSSDAAVRALLVTAVLFALAMGLYAFSTSLVAAVLAYWFVVAVRGVHTPLYTSWVNTGLQSASRATVNSLGSQSDALGQVAGGPVLGWIAAARSLRAAIGAAAVLAVPAAGLVRRGRRVERPS
jgi:hypothetical protein